MTKFRATILFAFSIGLTLTAVAFAHNSDAASTSIPIGIHKGAQGATVGLGPFTIPAGRCTVTTTNNGSARVGSSVTFQSVTSVTLNEVEASPGNVVSGTFDSNGSVIVAVVLGEYTLEDGYTGAVSLEGAELDCVAPATTTQPPVVTTVPPVTTLPPPVLVPPTRFTG